MSAIPELDKEAPSWGELENSSIGRLLALTAVLYTSSKKLNRDRS